MKSWCTDGRRRILTPGLHPIFLFTKKGRLRAFSQTQVAVEFYDGATEYYDARGAMVMPDFTANGAADTRWIKYAMIAVVILIIVATAMGVPIG